MLIDPGKQSMKILSDRVKSYIDGGGIVSPDGILKIKDYADCMVIGTHFERSDAADIKQFITAVRL